MTVTPLITAAEGFPALEQLVASATQTLTLSFRVLDPRTRLRSPDLIEDGLETWADLIADASTRGVRIRILLADFDALFTPDLHRDAWAAASGFADVVQGDAQILCAPHGQRAGWLWRFAMRTTLTKATQALKAEDKTRLTPVQRSLLNTGPVLRPVTHHQKFAVADGNAVFIGGLDVDERRFDDLTHNRPAEETWHDIAVRLDDADFAGALLAHFGDCWNAALTDGAPSLAQRATPVADQPRPQSRQDLRLLRTFSQPRRGLAQLGPRASVTDHEDALIRLFRSARDTLYIETQFLRHAPLVEALETASKRPDLQLTVLLPAAPERMLFGGDDSANARHAHGLQTDALLRLTQAFGNRLALLAPAQARAAVSDAQVHGAEPIYLHSKLAIIDRAVTVIGSANLNGRSLLWDSEASVLIRDRDVAHQLMTRLAAKWLRGSQADPWQAQTWQAVAAADAALPPPERQSLIVPFPLAKANRASRRLFGLPDALF